MPQLLIDFIASLDGYGAADGWPGWWGLEGPEYLAWLGEQPEAEYTVLMGGDHLPPDVGIRPRRRARHRRPGGHVEDRLLDHLERASVLAEVVFPSITGSSGRKRIYDGYPDVALDMISSRTFDGRIELLEYVPTILAGPPGTNTVNGPTSQDS